MSRTFGVVGAFNSTCCTQLAMCYNKLLLKLGYTVINHLIITVNIEFQLS